MESSLAGRLLEDLIPVVARGEGWGVGGEVGGGASKLFSATLPPQA